MPKFYISTTDPKRDIRRCAISLRDRTPITITGETDAGESQTFTGVVRSIEDTGDPLKNLRWQVTIQE